MKVFLQSPEGGWVGDTMPFFWKGEYHIFYLKAFRTPESDEPGYSVYHIGTRNFVNYTDYGEAIPRGSEEDQDHGICTGCVIRRNGIFHFFFGGDNKAYPARGKSQQVLMHSTSRDLVHWVKDPGFVFPADGEIYDLHDMDLGLSYRTHWRDPYVFWNDEKGEYWMLVTAAVPIGPHRQKGCIGLCTSKDLENWEYREPFWAPGSSRPQEVPDLFRMGDWWYLVFSRVTTQYRMSRSLSGPWLAPPHETFDGGLYYAGKTASDGRRRFVFGWNPTREGESDSGDPHWGGNLVIHELVQQADGRLTTRVPGEIDALFSNPLDISPRGVTGNWETSDRRISADAADSFAWCALAETPDTFRLETSIRFEKGTRACGVFLRADEDLKGYYQFRLEPQRGRIVFDSCSRPGAQPFGPAYLLERPVGLKPGENVDLKILVEDSTIVAYVNEEAALSARGYDHRTGLAGIFVSEGRAIFEETSLKTTPSQSG